MELLKPKIEDYPGKLLKLKIDNEDLDFAEAKDFAKQKAEETCADPMLLSWYQGKTGESYPNLECGPGDKPAWITYITRFIWAYDSVIFQKDRMV